MTDFKAGGVPTPDYDTEDINYVSQKTEFTEDVFVYGKLYADLGGDVQTFSTAGVERLRIDKSGNLLIGTNSSTVYDDSRTRLGLGTNNPDTTLTVQSGGDAQMSLKNSSGTTKAYVGTAGAFGSAGTDDLRIRSDSNNIVFGFSGTEKLRIDKDGQVIFIPMTETQRDALTAQAGGVIYNSTTNKLQCYNGTTWNNLF